MEPTKARRSSRTSRDSSRRSTCTSLLHVWRVHPDKACLWGMTANTWRPGTPKCAALLHVEQFLGYSVHVACTIRRGLGQLWCAHCTKVCTSAKKKSLIAGSTALEKRDESYAIASAMARRRASWMISSSVCFDLAPPTSPANLLRISCHMPPSRPGRNSVRCAIGAASHFCAHSAGQLFTRGMRPWCTVNRSDLDDCSSRQ